MQYKIFTETSNGTDSGAVAEAANRLADRMTRYRQDGWAPEGDIVVTFIPAEDWYGSPSPYVLLTQKMGKVDD